MALEYELKYLNPDLDGLRGRLEVIGAMKVAGPYYEENLVFDYEDRSLKAQGILLRLRQKGGKDAVLTVKRPSDADQDSRLKVLEEHETKVSDFEATRMVLETLGYAVAFRYDKVREKWHLNGVDICMDTLPFGDFVELEGPEQNVCIVAEKTGLDGCETTKATYHQLNREHRDAQEAQPDENFVFTREQKDVLLSKL